ncbi:ERCC4-related helicase [Geosmithia morbida]|uniref:ERCC4-related helicase n=1 Tax=Geosmithia morbida TaxID=1094350 RepID=A0A9P5D2Y4_9HYPO|nr:ERCC4-related helicase [Geosmithia morbida]KAF4121966.1 ERCC4-related helicase [Geosmithia morbida]
MPSWEPDSASDDDSGTPEDQPHLSLGDEAELESFSEPSVNVIQLPEEPDRSQDEGRMIDARAYQREMFEESLKYNAIVVMPTGSGKTQVALLRIAHELEHGPHNKIVWLNAPTILLCAQHLDSIKDQMPSVPARLLTGNENVDSWSPPTWTAILEKTRIIVSTPKVLHDALCHAFVKMDMLSLIVFDEAHNCVGRAAGNKVMEEFYHTSMYVDGSTLPSILGLTASPAMSSKGEEMKRLERMLDSRCITPNLHRQELLKYVMKPQIQRVDYAIPRYPEPSPAMSSLRQVYRDLDLREDPWIKYLVANLTDKNRDLLSKAVESNKTFSQDQMKGFCRVSLHIAEELGLWAAERYIWRVVTEFTSRPDADKTWISGEKEYLATNLLKVTVSQPPAEPSDMTDKARLLIDQLMSPPESPRCIIFARERATVSMLYEMLTSCPEVADRYRIGAIVGTSNHSSKNRHLYELSSNVTDLSVLQKFRTGKLNLVIATSVLEEGIDVPACNLVICFDRITSFKAFIQRRGRARMRESRLVLFWSDRQQAGQWEAMESHIQSVYEDSEREWQKLEYMEQGNDEDKTFFQVRSTGARLGIDDAKQHLEHFCRTLAPGEFVDGRPDYIIEQDSSSGPALSATVVLPSFVPAAVRRATSRTLHATEKSATKDAALQAYIALYRAGLLNDNLLPFQQNQEMPGSETRDPTARVDGRFSPWEEVARAWNDDEARWAYTYTCIDERGQPVGDHDVILPAQINHLQPLKVYIDSEVVWELRPSQGRLVPAREADAMPDHTSALLESHFGHRYKVLNRRHVIQTVIRGADLSVGDIASLSFEAEPQLATEFGHLIRDRTGAPFVYRGSLPSKPEIGLVKRAFFDYEDAPHHVPYLVLERCSRRSDFLHPLSTGSGHVQKSKRPYGSVYPAPWARVDAVPLSKVRFGMLIPSVMHEMEVMLVAKTLSETLLKPLGMTDHALVREAISAPSACEPVNYEQLEYLGDSILKYCTCIMGTATYLHWPESYLSIFKSQVVSNARLARACVETGLSRYVITKPFTGNKWRPLYLDDVSREPAGSRELSTKTLADVVEALIGAAYEKGGLDKASRCIALFIDDQDWTKVPIARQILFDHQPNSTMNPEVLAPVEEIIGYRFQKKQLLADALTHSSCMLTQKEQKTMERLEFIGDAILDWLVVAHVWADGPAARRTYYQMHLIKMALVAGDFLGFICLENGRYREDVTVSEDGQTAEPTSKFEPLWSFMRHGSPALALEQKAGSARHLELRGQIRAAMDEGTHHPWALLSRIRARKFFSDLIEALIGAVWVDSGSLETCKAMIDRLGILPYLDRVLRDGVNVQHPKEMLGQYAGRKKVRYEIEEHLVGSGEDRHGRWTCRIHVGDRLVVEVGDGVSKEEVMTRAATEAAWVLKGESG